MEDEKNAAQFTRLNHIPVEAAELYHELGDQVSIWPLEKRLQQAVKEIEAGLNNSDVETCLSQLDYLWRMERLSPSLVSVYIQILVGCGYTDRLMELFGDLAVADYLDGNYNDLFRLYQRAFWLKHNRHCPIISRLVKATCEQHRLPEKQLVSAGKYRVGHLLWGETDPTSALTRIASMIVSKYDPARIEVEVFSFQAEEMMKSKLQEMAVRDLINAGFSVTFYQGDDTNYFQAIVQFARQLREAELDVLVFHGGPPPFRALAWMRPAPILLGFDHGDPYTYSSEAIDGTLTCTRHLLRQQSTDSWFLPKCYFPGPPQPDQSVTRSTIGASQDHIVIMTAGYADKFDPENSDAKASWEMMGEILAAHKNIRWVIVGLTETEVQPILECMGEAERAQVLSLGQVLDLTPYLNLADIYADTYPVSGGLTMIEALRAGLATFTYRFSDEPEFNKAKRYTLIGHDLVDGPFLLVDPTVQAYKEKIESLLDPKIRHEVASQAKQVAEELTNYGPFIRSLEFTYQHLIEHKIMTQRMNTRHEQA